jgi:HlyD family secretion protein
MEISLEEGSFVQPGMEILEVGNEEAMYIETDILVSEIGGVKEGAKTLVYNEDIGIPHIKGEVRKIYPKAFNKVSDLGIEQKRVRVEIDIPNNVPKLKLGYDMDVKILTHFKENIITVPENSVFELEDGQYVFIAQNGKAVLRRVKTGIEGEDMIEIVSGIKEGEKVIISPHKDLEEGMDIEEI